MVRIVLVALGIFYLSLTVESSSDWTGFRGPRFDGSAVDGRFAAAPGELAVAWRGVAGSGYSEIAVSNGRVIHAFSDGTHDVVAAFDSQSGKEIWRSTVAPTYKGHDGSHDGPLATPAIFDGRVFFLHGRGQLVALDLASGKTVWSLNLAESHGAVKPHYGFTASPLVAGGVLVVEMGGPSGKAIAGFDPRTGKLQWTAGEDTINYQSPVLVRTGGREFVLAVGDKKLFVINPDGKLELEWAHEGDDASTSLVPLPVDADRVLLRTKNDSSDMIRLFLRNGTPVIEKLWTAGVFKGTYSTPVHHNGFLYGFSGRVLTAVDAATGETKWRSRGVGDGFLLLVNGQLVVQSKSGILHIGPASPEGWKESARVEAFKDLSWTTPSFAGGALFSRSLKEIIRMDWRPKSGAAREASSSSLVPASSIFGQFLSDVGAAADKKAVVDSLIAQNRFPLVEWPDRITFVYRGDAEDVALAGDLAGSRTEKGMQRVDGTDLFYHSTRLEPDARINYRFVRNYEENVADSFNPRATTDRQGNPLSWIGMPAWREPAHLAEAPHHKRGRVEAHELKSHAREAGSAKFDVYLPPGYDQTGRYPVVYIYDGASARTSGFITHTLDNLIGETVEPVIAVLLGEIKSGPEPLPDDMEEARAVNSILVQDIVPFVDAKYRTRGEASSRAIAGSLYTAFHALYAVFAHPDLFGGVATQSAYLQTSREGPLKEMIPLAEDRPLRIYMDWGGLYDGRNLSEGWDLASMNRDFAAFLRSRGYRPAGGETHDSYGWASWRNRTDRLLTALFPRER